MTIALALSALGICVPQLVMGVVDKTPKERADVPNGEASFEAAILPGGSNVPMQHEAPETGFMNEPGMEAAMPSGVEQDLSLPKALSMASKQLEIRNAQEKRVDLSDLLNAFRPDEKPQKAPSVENLQKELSQVIVEEQSSQSEQVSVPAITDAEALNQYCSQQVLSAVIWGGNGSIAMINGKVVRPGDVLGHGVKVNSIDRRSVELTYRDESQFIGMPAFETRRPSSSTSTADGPSEEPGSESSEESETADPTLGDLAGEQEQGAPGTQESSTDQSNSGTQE